MPKYQVEPMGRIILTIDENLENEFRKEIAARLGMKKGNIQIAAQEAIQLWIAQKPRLME